MMLESRLLVSGSVEKALSDTLHCQHGSKLALGLSAYKDC